MKVATLNDDQIVNQVFTDIEDPVIYPSGNKIVHKNGTLDYLGQSFILVKDHVRVVPGQQIDEPFYMKHDETINHIKMSFN